MNKLIIGKTIKTVKSLQYLEDYILGIIFTDGSYTFIDHELSNHIGFDDMRKVCVCEYKDKELVSRLFAD